MTKGYPQAEHYKALIEMRKNMKNRGIATFITGAGIFKVDYNFNPPIVKKIEPEEQDG